MNPVVIGGGIVFMIIFIAVIMSMNKSTAPMPINTEDDNDDEEETTEETTETPPFTEGEICSYDKDDKEENRNYVYNASGECIIEKCATDYFEDSEQKCTIKKDSICEYTESDKDSAYNYLIGSEGICAKGTDCSEGYIKNAEDKCVKIGEVCEGSNSSNQYLITTDGSCQALNSTCEGPDPNSLYQVQSDGTCKLIGCKDTHKQTPDGKTCYQIGQVCQGDIFTNMKEYKYNASGECEPSCNTPYTLMSKSRREEPGFNKNNACYEIGAVCLTNQIRDTNAEYYKFDEQGSCSKKCKINYKLYGKTAADIETTDHTELCVVANEGESCAQTKFFTDNVLETQLAGYDEKFDYKIDSQGICKRQFKVAQKGSICNDLHRGAASNNSIDTNKFNYVYGATGICEINCKNGNALGTDNACAGTPCTGPQNSVGSFIQNGDTCLVDTCPEHYKSNSKKTNCLIDDSTCPADSKSLSVKRDPSDPKTCITVCKNNHELGSDNKCKKITFKDSLTMRFYVQKYLNSSPVNRIALRFTHGSHYDKIKSKNNYNMIIKNKKSGMYLKKNISNEIHNLTSINLYIYSLYMGSFCENLDDLEIKLYDGSYIMITVNQSDIITTPMTSALHQNMPWPIQRTYDVISKWGDNKLFLCAADIKEKWAHSIQTVTQNQTIISFISSSNGNGQIDNDAGYNDVFFVMAKHGNVYSKCDSDHLFTTDPRKVNDILKDVSNPVSNDLIKVNMHGNDCWLYTSTDGGEKYGDATKGPFVINAKTFNPYTKKME